MKATWHEHKIVLIHSSWPSRFKFFRFNWMSSLASYGDTPPRDELYLHPPIMHFFSFSFFPFLPLISHRVFSLTRGRRSGKGDGEGGEGGGGRLLRQLLLPFDADGNESRVRPLVRCVSSHSRFDVKNAPNKERESLELRGLGIDSLSWTKPYLRSREPLNASCRCWQESHKRYNTVLSPRYIYIYIYLYVSIYTYLPPFLFPFCCILAGSPEIRRTIGTQR